MTYDDFIAKRKSCPFRCKVVIRNSDAERQQAIANWLLSTLPSDAYSLQQPVIPYSYDRLYFFKRAEDAILFKLTWDGE